MFKPWGLVLFNCLHFTFVVKGVKEAYCKITPHISDLQKLLEKYLLFFSPYSYPLHYVDLLHNRNKKTLKIVVVMLQNV